MMMVPDPQKKKSHNPIPQFIVHPGFYCCDAVSEKDMQFWETQRVFTRGGMRAQRTVGNGITRRARKTQRRW